MILVNLYKLQNKVYSTLIELGYDDILFCGDNYKQGLYTSTWHGGNIVIVSQIDINDTKNLAYQIFKAS